MYSAVQFVVEQNMIHPSTKCGNKITSMWPFISTTQQF